jgi:hypothetical protein
MTYRRRLLRPAAAAYAKALAECRADLAQMNFRHQCALADLHRELDQTRAAFEELKDVVRRRVAAEAELASLRRERELMLALSAERDPAMPLQ